VATLLFLLTSTHCISYALTLAQRVGKLRSIRASSRYNRGATSGDPESEWHLEMPNVSKAGVSMTSITLIALCNAVPLGFRV